ncbi:putative hydroxypyruvate isomerase [Oscarella lobularis]|uniref:putative hydroxypyruvate isomerase n=1 Tax=Oscarella lobularis TaxID=121494 RepID=UPI003313585D
MEFAANLSFLFREVAFLERFSKARDSGFRGVECAFPYDVDLDELVRAKEEANVEQILLNAPPGDWSAGERGLGVLAGREDEFREKLLLAIKYCRALDCKRLHVMAGIAPAGDREECGKIYRKNLGVAAELLEENGITLLIEPITTIPGYYLTSPKQALEIVEFVGHPNLKILYDIFHAQRAEGNLSSFIETNIQHIGHVQVSQVPLRNEPNNEGEINYPFLFDFLCKIGYKGWIGCEYTPKGKTEDGLASYK